MTRAGSCGQLYEFFEAGVPRLKSPDTGMGKRPEESSPS